MLLFLYFLLIYDVKKAFRGLTFDLIMKAADSLFMIGGHCRLDMMH